MFLLKSEGTSNYFKYYNNFKFNLNFCIFKSYNDLVYILYQNIFNNLTFLSCKLSLS